MAIRVYKCSTCGHKMRLSDHICHSCYDDKLAYQWPETFWLMVTGVIMGLSALAVVVL